MNTLQTIESVFRQRFGSPALRTGAPGRINLIGEHTDYNDGFVLPGAIDKKLYFVMAENGTRFCRVHALDVGEYEEMNLDELRRGPLLWANYLKGILDQLQQAGHEPVGVDCVFGGNLPIGSGMSSSAALECGWAFGLNTLFRFGLSRPVLARLAKQSSHQFVGIPCGIMDQFTSLMGKKDHFVLLDCRSLEYRYIPVDLQEYCLVLLNSKVKHQLVDSEYLKRVQECASGVNLIQRRHENIRNLRDVTPEMLEGYRKELGELIYRRCAYVVKENQRVHQTCDLLRSGDIRRVGELLFQTHAGLRDEYEVSCPEIDFLVDFARSFDGAAGARVMGGGFGGCTINLVKQSARDDFMRTTMEAYSRKTGIQGEAYPVNIVDGVTLC